MPASPKPCPWDVVAAEFETAATSLAQLPAPVGAEIAFAGRSNVGKSSLMNALLGRRKLVRTSSTPGCTRQVAFFRAQARDGAVLRLVDLPGYGYAQRSRTERADWGRLIEGYLRGRESLRAVVVLIDARLGLTDADAELLAFLGAIGEPKPFVLLVATKIDKVARSRQRAQLDAITSRLGLPVIGASAVSGEGIDAIWRRLRRVVLGASPGAA